MTAPKLPPRGKAWTAPRNDEHTALLAWEQELAADRASIPHCGCFVTRHDRTEYHPEGCELHRDTLGKDTR